MPLLRLTAACLVVLVLAGTGPVQAQKLVRGTVADAETGQGLPGATVQVENTSLGTTTNADGVFALYLDRLPATLRIRFIGYDEARVAVEADTPADLAVPLQPATYALDEVVITGEDPAVNIMRRVIAKKQGWLDSLHTYRAEAYTRFMLYRRGELVQMRETLSEAYWRAGDGPREYVRAERRRPPGMATFRFAAPAYIPNFYDDNVELMGFRFMGPTHPEALDAYTFTFGGRRKLGDQLVYEIYATPRDPLQSTLVGRLAVLADEYVLLEAQLRPSWYAVRPAPIQDWRVRYEQHFAPTPEGYWLPVDVRIEGDVSFGRTGVRYPTAHYEQISNLTFHIPNWPVPDSLYAGEPRIRVDPYAPYQDYLFSNTAGAVPLTAREAEAVARMNPRLTLRGAFAPSGLLTQYGAVRLEADPPEAEGTSPAEPGRRWPNLWSWYNRVDGGHLGLKHTLGLPGSLTLDAGAGYASARKALAYQGALTYHWGLTEPNTWTPTSGFFQIGHGRFTQPTYASATYTQAFNSIPTYFGFDDYFDYFDNQRTHAAAGLRSGRLRSTMAVGVNLETHRALEKNTDHEGWWVENVQRENPAVPTGALRSLTARWTLGDDMPKTAVAPGARSLELEVEHSRPGLMGSTFDFTSVRLQARASWPTFFRRRAWPNALHLYIAAGTARGDLPPQRWGALDVATKGLNVFGAFRSRRGLPYVGDRYVGLFWEHDFATVPFERLRLGRLTERGLGLTIHGAHGRTWLDEPAAPQQPVPSAFHHELGVSLTHLLGFPIRLDAAWRLDQPGFRVGVGLARRLGGGR